MESNHYSGLEFGNGAGKSNPKSCGFSPMTAAATMKNT
jgi:hypothetical protein